jgi:N-acetylornithine carbamoyltransferase
MSIHGLETRSGNVMDGVAAEHLREAIPVISSYGDALGIRAFANRVRLEDDLADTEYRAMRELVRIPLINMESAIQHPCQSLADWKTMDELRCRARAASSCCRGRGTRRRCRWPCRRRRCTWPPCAAWT